MKIGYFSPSYKRPQKSSTQKIYPFVKLVVREKEAKEYMENGNNVDICPNDAQGNISRIRNWIYETFIDKYDAVCLLDDDYKGVGVWQCQKSKIMDGEELQEFTEKLVILASDYGFKFAGLNPASDKGAYMEHTPYSTNKFIGGPYHLILKGNICRYDERIPLKEDYDFTLQNLKEYGGCLRANYAHHIVRQAEQVGGCATYRNNESEKEQFLLLQKKWGSKIIQKDSRSKKEFDFNPILKSPVKGV